MRHNVKFETVEKSKREGGGGEKRIKKSFCHLSRLYESVREKEKTVKMSWKPEKVELPRKQFDWDKSKFNKIEEKKKKKQQKNSHGSLWLLSA